MPADKIKRGLQELRHVRRQNRALFWIVGVFSLFANLLILAGPMYMLQVYDRVLASGSVQTLVALSVLLVFLYGVMVVLDFVRSRIMAGVAMRFTQTLEPRVFDAVMRKSAVLPDAGTASGLNDLETVRRLIGGPLVTAMFDLPWTPVFFAVIFVFHPILGLMALGGAGALVMLTLGNQLLTHSSQNAAQLHALTATSTADQLRNEAETVRALGMRQAAFARWNAARQAALAADVTASNTGTGFSTVGKTARLLLQSAMLGVGAWLVLGGQMTPGGMIAGSVLLGRALAPVEAMLNQWPMAQQAAQSWARLAALLGEVQPASPRTELPAPDARLVVQGLTVVPPAERIATLKAVGFTVAAGQAVGVIGPSGSGKSSLARALVGVWPPAGGSVRLGGAALDQYDPEVLGQHIGYLPQRVFLFDGTIAQNIARLIQHPDDERVVEAAAMAGAHEMILALPDGYDTPIRAGQMRLSGGQLQRIGLARALYGDPALVVLDEPNSNLDNEGSDALNTAIRHIKARGRSVLIMAHRPAAIAECEMLLVLDAGSRVAFGPKQEVMAGMVKNARTLDKAPARAGGMR